MSARLSARKHDLSVSADGCQIINEPVGNFLGALKLIHKSFRNASNLRSCLQSSGTFYLPLSKFNLIRPFTSHPYIFFQTERGRTCIVPEHRRSSSPVNLSQIQI